MWNGGEIMAIGGAIIWDDSEFNEMFHTESGPAFILMRRVGEIVTQGAKRRAPVSPDGSNGRPSGYMRSQIGWIVGTDSEGLYVDVVSPATTPSGYPYGLGVEVGTVAHVIRSHGPYPLRNKHGRVFGMEVHHPGTNPQPYLRPAFDDVRGNI